MANGCMTRLTYALSLPLVIPPIVCAVMMVFMPESPVLLVIQRKYVDAERTLKFYRGEDFDIRKDMEDIEYYLNCDNGNFLQNIKNVVTLKCCGVLTSLFVLIEMSPIATAFIYDDIIFVSGDNYGITRTGCAIMSMSLIQMGIIIAGYLIDILGRKKLLMISTGVTGCTQALLGIYYIILAFNEIYAQCIEFGVMWVLYLSKIGYGIGAAPIVYCLVGELPTPGAKKGMLAVTFGVFWMCTYISLHVYPLVVEKIGEGALLLITSCFYGVAFIIVSLFLVETKCKTLFEVQIELKNKLQAMNVE